MGTRVVVCSSMAQGGLFKGKAGIKKKQSGGKLRKAKTAGPRVGERKNAKKADLFKDGPWGGKDSYAATQAINQKNEDEAHARAAKKGSPFTLVKASGMGAKPDKK